MPSVSEATARYRDEMHHLTYIRHLCEVQKYSRKIEPCNLHTLANGVISIVGCPCVGPNPHNDTVLLYNASY